MVAPARVVVVVGGRPLVVLLRVVLLLMVRVLLVLLLHAGVRVVHGRGRGAHGVTTTTPIAAAATTASHHHVGVSPVLGRPHGLPSHPHRPLLHVLG